MRDVLTFGNAINPFADWLLGLPPRVAGAVIATIEHLEYERAYLLDGRVRSIRDETESNLSELDVVEGDDHYYVFFFLSRTTIHLLHGSRARSSGAPEWRAAYQIAAKRKAEWLAELAKEPSP